MEIQVVGAFRRRPDTAARAATGDDDGVDIAADQIGEERRLPECRAARLVDKDLVPPAAEPRIDLHHGRTARERFVLDTVVDFSADRPHGLVSGLVERHDGEKDWHTLYPGGVEYGSGVRDNRLEIGRAKG